MRLVDRIRIVVEQTGMSTNALDGFPRVELSCEEALHAPSNDEGFLILKVQASQYVKVMLGRVSHISMVRISPALSIGNSNGNDDICE